MRFLVSEGRGNGSGVPDDEFNVPCAACQTWHQDAAAIVPLPKWLFEIDSTLCSKAAAKHAAQSVFSGECDQVSHHLSEVGRFEDRLS
jgi:hypothetical protein